MLVLPAIDILNGKVVRLSEGKFGSEKIYADSVFEQAKVFKSAGFDFIHIVDLAGSKEGTTGVKPILRKIKTELNLRIEFGGGVRSFEDIVELSEIGVEKIVAGSMSVKKPQEILRAASEIGSEKIVIAVDALEGKVAIKGWTEITSLSLYEHIEFYLKEGIDTFLCTDIKKDGLLAGPSIGLYDKIAKKFPEAKIIASGGVSNIDDVKLLAENEMYACVVGRAIYENKITLEELKKIAE